jgi:hypothetical protein
MFDKKNIEQKEYGNALDFINKASKIILFEVPNFKFYSLRALVKFKLQNIDEAHSDLKKAKLSIMISSGLAKCYNEIEGLKGINGNLKEFDVSIIEEVSKNMCGGIYEPYYVASDFEHIKYNYELIKEYEQIQNIILEQYN